MPKKNLWGKHPDYNLFWQGKPVRTKLFAITQDSKFFWSDSSFSQPPSDEKMFKGHFNMVLLVCFSSESLFGKIGPNSNSKWPHENRFFSCNRAVWPTYCRKLPKVAMTFRKELSYESGDDKGIFPVSAFFSQKSVHDRYKTEVTFTFNDYYRL